MSADPTPRSGTEVLLGFARALRAAGVAVDAQRERAYLEAVAAVGLPDPLATYHAGRATLCASPEDLARHDEVYAAWFRAVAPHRAVLPRATAPVARAALDDPGADEGDGVSREEAVRAQASATELLRHRDIAHLSAAEREHLMRLLGGLRPRAPRRRAHRPTPAHRGDVDARRTLRATLRRLGEPAEVARRRRGTRARGVVLLVDVSGSMSVYADTLLRLAHRYVHTCPGTEVFTVGTRLTRVTPALAHRDPDRALVAVGGLVPDWSGGTRLAEALAVFLARWGRRGLARGAVVVVLSDGWERSRPEALGEQVRRLRALAHRVVWANPHRGSAAYAPVQSGIVAVLPHVDAHVAGHSLAAFTTLTEVVADA